MLHYHLSMCIKYRNKVIDDDISNRLREIFEYIAPKYNVILKEKAKKIEVIRKTFLEIFLEICLAAERGIEALTDKRNMESIP